MSGATWDNSGVNPVDDLEDWAITIQDKSGVVILDDTPIENSTNALSSGGAKTALDSKSDISGTAAKATADALSNEITATYATKGELSTVENKANEAKSIAEGQARASSFASYAELVVALNSATQTDYKIGDNFYIQTKNIPDLWVYSVEESSIAYTYNSDDELINTIETYGFIQIGYFKLSALETAKIDLTGFVPVSRTLNNKPLSENIILSAGDVSALAVDGTAAKATADDNGNNIATTYALQKMVVNTLATSGTVALTDNSVNHITPTGTVTFSLPSISDHTIFHQILVQVNLSSKQTINLGTSNYFFRTTPEFETVRYNIIYEHNGTH